MTERANPITLGRLGLAFVQSVVALAASGSVLLGAHKLFLWYFTREMQGIEVANATGCGGVERIVNGDLFEGETVCHQVSNLAPWLELYRRHWQVAATYYGAGLFMIIMTGLVIFSLRRRPTHSAPFGEAQLVLSPGDSEHLR